MINLVLLLDAKQASPIYFIKNEIKLALCRYSGWLAILFASSGLQKPLSLHKTYG